MSAGSGILHSEKNDSWCLGRESHRDLVHFVQMWVVPDESGITRATSSWRSTTSSSRAAWSRWRPAWPRTRGAAIRIKNRYAALYAVRFTDTGAQQVTATVPAGIVVWEMHATLAA